MMSHEVYIEFQRFASEVTWVPVSVFLRYEQEIRIEFKLHTVWAKLISPSHR